MLDRSSYDGYRGSSRQVPTSPTGSSATSQGERSPTSFYSFGQASTSTVKEANYASLDEGDDLGDRTFMVQEETPKKVDNGKGKQRATETDAQSSNAYGPFSSHLDEDADEADVEDPEEDSARIEEVSDAGIQKSIANALSYRHCAHGRKRRSSAGQRHEAGK